MYTPIIKRIKGLSWHTVMMSLPFITGFLTSQEVRNLVELYPKQLGILISIGLFMAQVTKAVNSYSEFKKEVASIE